MYTRIIRVQNPSLPSTESLIFAEVESGSLVFSCMSSVLFALFLFSWDFFFPETQYLFIFVLFVQSLIIILNSWGQLLIQTQQTVYF